MVLFEYHLESKDEVLRSIFNFYDKVYKHTVLIIKYKCNYFIIFNKLIIKILFY